MEDLKQFQHEDFLVHEYNDKYAFIHVEITGTSFYDKLFKHFFSEDKLLRYAENITNCTFNPTLVNYTILYSSLQNFIDDENTVISLKELNENIHDVIKNEFKHEKNQVGDVIIRLDKIGKIGEYIFSNILWDYFCFECIIPKIHLLTDPNMNVYGIDVLFYSPTEKLIMFGESKVTSNIYGGVKLIKESLKEYEKQIRDEYRLVLNNRFYRKQLNLFNNEFGNVTERCVSIEEFIAETGVKKIGIPIFIAHGTETDIIKIFNSLNIDTSKKILNLEVKYYLISLPIENKEKFSLNFLNFLRERRDEYGTIRKHIKSTEL